MTLVECCSSRVMAGETCDACGQVVEAPTPEQVSAREILTSDQVGDAVIVAFCPRCKEPLDQELYGPCKKCVEQLKGRAEERAAIIRKKLEERKARGHQSGTDTEEYERGDPL